MKEMKIVRLSMDGEFKSFSVEPEREGSSANGQYINDIVEEAILDAKEDGADFNEIADSVVFALADAGYIVRDFPENIETLYYDVENYKVKDIER